MTVEEQYLEKIKNKKPFETGNSLHVYHESYRLRGKVITLYYAIGDKTNTPDVEIKSKEEFEESKNLIENLFKKLNDKRRKGHKEKSQSRKTCNKA